MTWYKCGNCGEYVNEDDIEEINTSYEAYYDAPVSGHTPLTLQACPNCHSPEELEEIGDMYEIDGKMYEYEDAVDVVEKFRDTVTDDGTYCYCGTVYENVDKLLEEFLV